MLYHIIYILILTGITQKMKQQKYKYQKMKQILFMKGTERGIIEQLQNANNINFIDLIDENGNTSLHYAASLNYKKLMKVYLSLLKDKQLWRLKEGLNITSQIIKYKTRIFLNYQNNDGLTAVHYAASKGNVEIAQMLENDGARLDKQTNLGFTVLHLAAQENQITSMIYFRGKIDVNSSDINGSTALHWASSKGHQTIINYLISDVQLQLNFQDRQGRTALHIASMYGHYKLVQSLLMAGANRFIKDKQKRIAEDYANQKISGLLTQKQQCRCRPDYIYKPKTKQNCKWIVIIFVLLFGIDAANFFISETSIIDTMQDSSVQLTLINQSFIYSQYYFLGQIIMGVVAFILAFYLHFRISKIQKYSLQYIQRNPQISDKYCFTCLNMQEQTTYHCYYCHQCYHIQIKHSHILGRCIDISNRYPYLIFLILVDLLLLSQIVRGIGLLNYLIHQYDHQLHLEILKLVLTFIDWLCVLPVLFVSYFIYKTVKIICKLKRFTIIKQLSESTFDTRSTLIARKILNANKYANKQDINNKEISKNRNFRQSIGSNNMRRRPTSNIIQQ